MHLIDAKHKIFAFSFLTTLSCVAFHAGGQVAANLPDTTENIHLGLAFDNQVSNPNALAGKVDYVWGAGGNVPGAYQTAYVPYDEDEYGATISNHKAIQPDWIVYGCDEKTPSSRWGNPALLIDPLYGPAQSYQQSEISSTIAGQWGTIYNSIGIDGVEMNNDANRCGSWRNGSWVPLYGGLGASDNPLFLDAVVNWAQQLHSWFKSKYPAEGIAFNLNAARSGNLSQPYQDISLLFPYLDIDVSEQGFTGYGQNNYGYGYNVLCDADWQNTVESFETLNAQGKAFFAINIIASSTDQGITSSDINWVIANYLLVKGSHSYMYIYPNSNGYGSFYDRPEYHIQIGHPTSGRYSFQGVQRRDYSGGIVMVNPSSTQSFPVNIGPGYTDMYGNPISSGTFPPKRAIVLLNAN